MELKQLTVVSSISAITFTPDLGTISEKLLHTLSPVKYEQYMAKGREIILNARIS